MDFDGLHVVVTGGTGTLGQAVVAALIDAGATCHIPCRSESEAERFPFRDHAQAKLYPNCELGDERSVDRLFERVPALWASIHIAGGFAFGPLREMTEATLRRQIETNLVTCALCCRGALRAFARNGKGGRIVNVAARAAVEWRTGANMATYAASKAAVAALTVALAEEVVKEDVLVNAVAPSIGEPQGHAKGRFFGVAQSRGGRLYDSLSCFARQYGNARRDCAGIREDMRVYSIDFRWVRANLGD
jgi:NAD(P)-dependent dehydrogenase (short-subunit alcohol dehydrogenase family)